MLLLRGLLTVMFKAVLGAVVLGCIGASCFFAFEFGSGKAAVPELAMTYGLASGGLDLFKTSLPLLAASALANRQWSRGTLAWVAFAFLTVMSLWCAFGTTAGQLAERFANQVVAKTAEHDKASKLERLHGERAAIGTFSRVTLEGVKAAQDAVDSAVTAKTQECGDVGRNCRARVADETARRTELAQAIRDQATTAQADKLDREIVDTETIKIDVKAAEKDVDPQATSLAKATGVSEEKIALLSHVIFAIGIEIGSGLGLWLVFGHGAGEPRKEAEKAPTSPISSETNADLRRRFFQECVKGTTGRRTSAAEMHAAYSEWCSRQGRGAMAPQLFGKDAPWPKERAGGNVYYLNCALAGPRPALRIVAR